MKLKYKLALVSIVSIVFFFLINMYIQKSYILPTYKRIEHSEAGTVMCQAMEAINNEVRLIHSLTKELVLIKLNKKFTSPFLKYSNLNFILVYDQSKKIKFSHIVIKDAETKQKINLQLLQKFLAKKLLDQNKKYYSGLLNSPFGVLALSSAPKFNIDGKKTISSDTLIIGKILNTRDNFRITKNNFTSIYPISDNSLKQNSALRKIIDTTKMNKGISYVKSSNDDDFITCYAVIKNLFKKPAFAVLVKHPRIIYQDAYSTLVYALWFLVVFGIILIFITIDIIQFIVVKPISKLTKSTIQIRESGDLSLRTEFKHRNDEIGYLSSEFNILLSQLQHHIEDMEEIIERQTREIRLTREDTIFRLSMAIESKEFQTGKHITRVSKMAKLLAEKMELPKKKCETISIAGTMHDIGKIGLPEWLLVKSDKYTDKEYNTMKSHTKIGAGIFANGNSDLQKTAYEIALYHHEHWDGTGYPEELKGENIPISARITTIVDIFDALLTKRSYKGEHSPDETIQYIKDNSGKIFDPELAKIFIENIQEFIELRNKYPDQI